jgi:pimeloyl-ACP methyl ester carboxylesterase
VALAACSSSGAPSAASRSAAATSPAGEPTVPAIDEICDVAPGTLARLPVRTLSFTTRDGVELYGAIVGRGRSGVVLANDVPHPFCELVPPALSLARRGYRVIIFDYRGHGESSDGDAAGRLDLDVLAAVTELRRSGVDHAVLMGSYGGAAAAILAAVEADPPVDGLIGISPAPRRGEYIGGPFDPIGALQAAPRLEVPVLYVTAKEDRFVPLPEVRRLDEVTGSRSKRLVVVDDLPGWYLLRYDAQAAGVVFRFLRAHG